MELTEKRLDGEEKYRGIVVDIRVDRVSLPDGRESRREVVSHPGGVCVLPITEDGQVYLVRQFRYAVGRELLEVPAGKLEKALETCPVTVTSDGKNATAAEYAEAIMKLL